MYQSYRMCFYDDKVCPKDGCVSSTSDKPGALKIVPQIETERVWTQSPFPPKRLADFRKGGQMWVKL